jgi:exopolysaccharide biosynthesis polyprenyl glycosylphosphotransferase
VTVQELTGFSEHLFGRVPLESINAAWFMHLIHPFYRPYSRAAKRIADVGAALLMGMLSLPLLPIVALAVKLTSPGPVFYSQVRVGAGGRPFRIYKFRTMVEDAERNGVAWATPGDPRITRVGGIMRNTRIDEIPQLWNVIRGTMSFVGPRPERPEFVSELERRIPYYNRRHQLKPALTGWAQVRAGYADSVDAAADKLAYKLYYLKHRSLLFDVIVFMETIRVVLSRAGAR